MKFINEYSDEEIREHNKKLFVSLGINVIFDESIPEGEIREGCTIVPRHHLGDKTVDDSR